MNYKLNFYFEMLTKVLIGQAIDQISPQIGLAYHVTTTLDAKNSMEFSIGLLSIIHSGKKITHLQNLSTSYGEISYD